MKWNLAKARTAKPRKKPQGRRLKSVIGKVINSKAPKLRQLPQWMVDIGKVTSRKRKAPRKKRSPRKTSRKGQKLIVKLPPRQKKPPEQVPLTQPSPNTTLAMAQMKMNRAMAGPIGSQRTPDIQSSVFPRIKVPVHHIPRSSSLFSKVTGFSPLQDPDKKNKKGKYECRYCPMEFKLKKSRDQHEKTTHLGYAPP